MKYKELTVRVPENFHPYVLACVHEDKLAISHFDQAQTMDGAIRFIAGFMQCVIEQCCDLHEYNPTQREQLEAHFLESVENNYSSMKTEWEKLEDPGEDED